MKHPDENVAGRAFGTVMLAVFAMCLAYLFVRFLLLPLAADDTAAGFDFARRLHWYRG